MRTLMAHPYIVNGNVFACTENILSVTYIFSSQRHAVSLIVCTEGTLRSGARLVKKLKTVKHNLLLFVLLNFVTCV